MTPFSLGGILLAFTLIMITIFMFTQKKRKNNGSSLGSIPANSKLTITLKEKEQLSHDTFNFIFTLPEEHQTLGIPIGKHYIIHTTIDGEEVMRKYTPTSVITQKGTFEQVVKIYRPNVHPKFPEGGQFTPLLEQLSIGGELKVSGPHGNLEYFGCGRVEINRQFEGGDIQKKQFNKIYMIAGGTGLTPMYQIIQQVCNDPTDNTELTLLYANKSEEDILLRKELESYARTNKLKLFFTLDTPADNWEYFSGFITVDMVKSCFKENNENILCVSCGPPPMTNLARQLFLQLGFKDNQYFKF